MIQAENEVIFNSVKSFMRILTKNRVEILIYINHQSPKSIYELVKGLKRDFKNVHNDVKKLAHLDLISIENPATQEEASFLGLSILDWN